MEYRDPIQRNRSSIFVHPGPTSLAGHRLLLFNLSDDRSCSRPISWISKRICPSKTNIYSYIPAISPIIGSPCKLSTAIRHCLHGRSPRSYTNHSRTTYRGYFRRMQTRDRMRPILSSCRRAAIFLFPSLLAVVDADMCQARLA
jgi:hypothetical protein